MTPVIPVLISMNSFSQTDPTGREPADPIRLLVPGELTIENGVYTLRYEESQTDEDTKANIDALEKLVAETVATKTKDALSKGAPPAGSGASAKTDLRAIAFKAAGLKL